MIDPLQFKHELVLPVLERMSVYFRGADHPAAVNLMIGTAFKESHGGTFLVQIGGGPALGFWQGEPATEASLWANHLRYHKSRRDFVCSIIPAGEAAAWRQYIEGMRQAEKLGVAKKNTPVAPNFRRAMFDLQYALVMARMKYWVRSFDWPEDPNDIQALAEIWDRIYNVNDSHGFPHEFVELFPMEVLE